MTADPTTRPRRARSREPAPSCRPDGRGSSRRRGRGVHRMTRLRSIGHPGPAGLVLRAHRPPAAPGAGVPASRSGWRWRSGSGSPCSPGPGLGLAAGLICVPVRGWSAAQWIGVLARHAGRDARPAGPAGSPRPRPGELGATPGEADLPGVLAGIRIHDGPPMPGAPPGPRSSRTTPPAPGRRPPASSTPASGWPTTTSGSGWAPGSPSCSRPPPPAARSTWSPCRSAPSPTTAPSAPSGCASNARADEPELSARIHAQLDAMHRRRRGAHRGVRDRGGARGRDRRRTPSAPDGVSPAEPGSCTASWPRSRPG